MMSAERLAALPAAEVVVLDVRWRLGGPPGRGDYDAAHIPGAVFVDLDTELADPPGPGGRHPLPDPVRLQAVLRRAGVRSDAVVVAYDDGNGAVAARAWWLLRWAGISAERVAVLDGGWAGWVAEGRPTTAEPGRPAEGDIVVRPGAMPVLDADAAAETARSGVLLDARAAPRYRGETEPVDPQAGHIPGARNLPATEIAGPDGRARTPADLVERFAERGATGATPVAAYCGSGVNAAALVLAAEHAGLRPPEHPVALYPGSWSQWSSDPSRPVATGADP
jgi:thiosulfate/3-mercaptopyruvate sulfurtransferase